MGDGPNAGAGDGNKYRRIDEMPWPEGPETIPKRYAPNGQPLNALDAQREPSYPDQLNSPFLPVPAAPYGADRPALDVSESFRQLTPLENTIKKADPSAPLHGPFPTPAEVHAQTGRFWNTNFDMAQLAWHGYNLWPHKPWPALPKMFPMWPLSSQNTHANWKNLTNAKLMSPVTQKFAPIGIAGVAFAVETQIDKAFDLDKTEFQTGRIFMDYFGPSIALSSRPWLKNWLVKGVCMIGTHTAGRLFDKFTETPIKKFMRTGDE